MKRRQCTGRIQAKSHSTRADGAKLLHACNPTVVRRFVLFYRLTHNHAFNGRNRAFLAALEPRQLVFHRFQAQILEIPELLTMDDFGKS